MATDIASALGIGSGINITQMVSDLTNASFQPRQSAVQSRLDTASARVSALASAKSSLETFSKALTDLLQGTGYRGNPVSNDPTIAAVSLIPGGVPKGLPAQLEVRQLAAGQVLQSAALADSAAVAGTGTLKLTVGSTETMITVGGTGTLADLASAINAANAGVTASIVTDQSGARLVLKGETGTAKAFTLTAEADADANLQRFVWDGAAGTLTQSQVAANALIRIDNVDMEFGSNKITTAIPNIQIDLNKAEPGKTITLATDQPTSTMSDLVREFVTAYNQLKGALNDATVAQGDTAGLLSGDFGVRDLSRRLAGLVSQPLTDSGTYRTLSDLGVRTERNGTLTLDTKRLEAALAADPEGVTQMLNPAVPSATQPGIAGALKDITDYVNGSEGPLASSAAIYGKQKAALEKELEKLDDQRSTYSTQLTATYSKMQTRLLQFQATQSYLEQQVKIWSQNND
ncbi:flagellar hook-associated protein 2 [Sphingobium sp. B7D2B]|uniref:flagellar filament capping protein FliD n=1 Tax=Sphingobium sp. B7D2B TaxID=2940583 RepID=UPI0022247F29|nr:flagellar filament capping protein FliD [Sphingobium sp. B7D2B]MCW2364912.1 flagellar hook-associated protein 2 [Sphingobium sp. B7D2B]